jgi:hypothetical protein
MCAVQLPQRKAESNIPPIEEIISQETHALARRLKKVALAARLVMSPRGLAESQINADSVENYTELHTEPIIVMQA